LNAGNGRAIRASKSVAVAVVGATAAAVAVRRPDRVSERAIERANKQASERLASERASVVVAVVGAAAATFTVRRPERVSDRASERASERARERESEARASERTNGALYQRSSIARCDTSTTAAKARQMGGTWRCSSGRPASLAMRSASGSRSPPREKPSATSWSTDKTRVEEQLADQQ